MELEVDGNRLQLTGHLDGRSTEQVRETLRTMAESHDSLVVDLRRVESVDVVALTMLAAATKVMQRHGRQLVLRGCSPALRRTIAYTRVRAVLQLEREAPATTPA
jgi:anti-anti-sigma factor